MSKATNHTAGPAPPRSPVSQTASPSRSTLVAPTFSTTGKSSGVNPSAPSPAPRVTRPGSAAGPLPQLLVKAILQTRTVSQQAAVSGPTPPQPVTTPSAPTQATPVPKPLTTTPTAPTPTPTSSASPSSQTLPPANPPARPRRTTDGIRSHSHKAPPNSKSVPPRPDSANASSFGSEEGAAQSMAEIFIEWHYNTIMRGPSLPASPRSTLNTGKKKNDFAADNTRTWTSTPSTDCPAMWNSLIDIEFATFFVEFLIFDNYSNPSSTCSYDYRGCLIQIINGPPEKSFVVSSSTTATGPHLPSTKLAETPHPQVHTVMWNYSPFQDCYPLTSFGPSSCQCDTWLKSQPWLPHVQGHVAAGLDEFRFPGTPHHVHYTSALASYYVDFAVYEVQVHERLRKWCLHHGLPLLMEHLRSQFQQRRKHARTHQLLTKHQLNILHRHLGQAFVCHNEDHDNHHLMFFCPQLYFKGLHNTWLQSSSFEATTLRPDQAEAIILEAIPKHLRQRYKCIPEEDRLHPGWKSLSQTERAVEVGSHHYSIPQGGAPATFQSSRHPSRRACR